MHLESPEFPAPASVSALRELGRDLLCLIWPTSCVVCGAPDRDFCRPCLDDLRRIEGRFRWVRASPGLEVCVGGGYVDPVRSLLLACKHGGRPGLSRHLGATLRGPLYEAMQLARGPSPPLLVTAPSRGARVRERGYRHVDLIVRAALGRTGPRLVGRALRARRGRRAQIGLDHAARQRNARLVEVRRAARSELAGREVIVIDDVVTTGATVEAACRVVGAAGARVIAVVALCAVEKKG